MRVFRVPVLLLSGLLFFSTPSGAWNMGGYKWVGIAFPPKAQPVIPLSYKCYDIEAKDYIPCSFTSTAKYSSAPIFNFFGFQDDHHHYDPVLGVKRPLGTLRKAGDVSAGAETISGYAASGLFSVEYLSPEVTAPIEVVTAVAAPSKWSCVQPADCTIKTFIQVRYSGSLSGLPPNDYIEFGYSNPATLYSHSPTNYCTWETCNRIRVIAYSYYFEDPAVHGKLSLNDLSLMFGGLLDYDKLHVREWSPPHKFHRQGISFDVNHANGVGNATNEVSLDDLSERVGCSRWEKKKNLIHYECDKPWDGGVPQ